ncbi:hypothetical protein [Marinobacter alkaliphilus]|uniref:Uncharacterized protein n=2 Tax=Marinobacter TaxID=2742 RepID=A0A455WC97_MARNT|nr:hypothetical protein YBY_21740 [Marinobacter nauticus]
MLQALGSEQMRPFTIVLLGLLLVTLLGFAALLVFKISVLPTEIEPAHFAAYGTLIGGVLTPMTIIVAAFALLQRERAHQAEMKNLQSQSNRLDLMRFIQKIEKDIQNALDKLTINVTYKQEDIHATGNDAFLNLTFLEWPAVIPSEKQVKERLKASNGQVSRNEPLIICYEAFSTITIYLNSLRQYCEEHDRLSGTNMTTLYFLRKYRIGIQRLSDQGYGVHKWKPMAQQNAQADTGVPSV